MLALQMMPFFDEQFMWLFSEFEGCVYKNLL